MKRAVGRRRAEYRNGVPRARNTAGRSGDMATYSSRARCQHEGNTEPGVVVRFR
jgi:hypothetical protein